MALVPSSEPSKESLAIESRKTKPSQNKENINMSQLEFQVKRKHIKGIKKRIEAKLRLHLVCIWC